MRWRRGGSHNQVLGNTSLAPMPQLTFQTTARLRHLVVDGQAYLIWRDVFPQQLI
jgi:hypothetical protein